MLAARIDNNELGQRPSWGCVVGRVVRLAGRPVDVVRVAAVHCPLRPALIGGGEADEGPPFEACLKSVCLLSHPSFFSDVNSLYFSMRAMFFKLFQQIEIILAMSVLN